MPTTLRNQNLFCLNCGSEHVLHYPVPIDEMSKKMKAFDVLHKDCKKTWTQPQVDQNKDVMQKAMWWIANGEKGNSSETMWNCLMGNKGFPINHPYDPDDFSRCYKLLKTVPEWNKQLEKLKPLSIAWSNLINNWSKLTEMFEQNEREQWKNYKKVGMYEFMKTLITIP